MKKKAKKKVAKKKTAKKTTEEATYKRGSLGTAIYSYFDKVGVDNADYEETLKLAKSVKSNTKYNKYHLSWYKNKYREIQEDKE